MLTLENVSLNYGSFKALDGVTLHAKQGELVVLLGANGAGKSSIFLTISGIHRAAGGSIQYDGQQLIGRKPSAIVQAGVVQCPEGRKLFPMMSVQKNLMLGAYVHRRESEPMPTSSASNTARKPCPFSSNWLHTRSASSAKTCGGQRPTTALSCLVWSAQAPGASGH